jgi:hypothetical protein
MFTRQTEHPSFKKIGQISKRYFISYMPNFLFVIQKNFFMMFVCSLYLVVATVLSQKAIAFSVDTL